MSIERASRRDAGNLRHIGIAGLLFMSMLRAADADAGELLGIHVLDRIVVPASVDDVRIDELSGLAWDDDENLLYAVSDRGYLHHFRLHAKDERLHLVAPVFSARIVGGGDTGSKAKLKNAEGLAVVNANNGRRGDTELLVVFEDGPSLERFAMDGRRIANVDLPPDLRDKGAYRSDNSRLEAVTVSRTHGFLIAPEKPLVSHGEATHEVYSLHGDVCTFDRRKRSSLRAMEVLSDETLLVLELQKPVDAAAVVTLRSVPLSKCFGKPVGEANYLQVLSGELPPVNFEGLTRIAEDLFVMVSDVHRDQADAATLILFRIARAR